jgi:hypothetical protein
MKIRNWFFGLLAALAIALISSGTAFAGPTYVHLNQKLDRAHTEGCLWPEEISSTDYKYPCGDGDGYEFTLRATVGKDPKTGKPYYCTFSGRTWTSGMFNQNWHHALWIENSSSADRCTISKKNENTWVAKIKTD